MASDIHYPQTIRDGVLFDDAPLDETVIVTRRVGSNFVLVSEAVDADVTVRGSSGFRSFVDASIIGRAPDGSFGVVSDDSTVKNLPLVAWFKSSYGFVLDESQLVSEWYDYSGSDNDVSQSNPSTRPTFTTFNGRTVLDTTNSSRLAFASRLTTVKSCVFVVNNYQESDPTISVVFGEDNAVAGSVHDYTFIRLNSADYTISIDGTLSKTGRASLNNGSLVAGTNINLGVNFVSGNGPDIFYVDWNDATIELDLIGGFQTLTNNLFGRNEIAEIVFFDRNLTDEERTSIYHYFRNYWRLNSVVPTITLTSVTPEYPDVNESVRVIFKINDSHGIDISTITSASFALAKPDSTAGLFSVDEISKEKTSATVIISFTPDVGGNWLLETTGTGITNLGGLSAEFGAIATIQVFPFVVSTSEAAATDPLAIDVGSTSFRVKATWDKPVDLTATGAFTLNRVAFPDTAVTAGESQKLYFLQGTNTARGRLSSNFRRLGPSYTADITTSSTYNTGQSYSLQVDFDGNDTTLFLDGSSIPEVKFTDGRGAKAQFIQFRSFVDLANVSNFEVSRIKPKSDIPWVNNLPAFNKININAPAAVGNTNGLPTRWWNWEVVDTKGLIDNPTKRYAVITGTDHFPDLASGAGIYLGWADAPDMTGLTSFTKVLTTNIGIGQLETPRVIWDSTNSRFILYAHLPGFPSAPEDRQSTFSYVSTDLTNWSDELVCFSANTPASVAGEPDYERFLTHTGYMDFVLIDGQYHGVGLGYNPTGDGALATLGPVTSKPVGDNLRSYEFDKWTEELDPTPYRRLAFSEKSYFWYKSELFYIGTELTLDTNWGVVGRRPVVKRVSKDLSVYSRKSLYPFTLSSLSWEKGLGGIHGVFTDPERNLLYVYYRSVEQQVSQGASQSDDETLLGIAVMSLN